MYSGAMEQEEQWDTPEQVLERLDRSNSLYRDWMGRLTTSVAAANGAGIIALGSYLTAGTYKIEPLTCALVSAFFFIGGLGLTTYAIAASASHHAFDTLRHRRRFQNIKARSKGVVLDVQDNSEAAAIRANEAAMKLLGGGILAFVVGFLFALLMVGVASYDTVKQFSPSEHERCSGLRGRMLNKASDPDLAAAQVYVALECKDD